MTPHHDRQRKADYRIRKKLVRISDLLLSLMDKEFGNIDVRDREPLREVRAKVDSIAIRYGALQEQAPHGAGDPKNEQR